MDNTQLAAEAALASVPQNATPEASPLTINEMLDAYVADRKNPFAKKPCLHPDGIESHFKVIRAEWGSMLAKDFRKGASQRIDEKVQEWRRGKIGPDGIVVCAVTSSTCRKRISQLRTAFNYAVRTERLKRKHLPFFDLPSPGAPRERFVDPARELPALLIAADLVETPHHIRLQNELLLRLGCRRGALLALRWSKHIDFENRIVRLRDTQTAEVRARNQKKRDNQPMDDGLYELLMDAKEVADCDYVISWKGKQVRSTYAGQKALYQRAGIENIHIHDLRRTSATYVYNELGGDLDRAAAHIADSKEMAERSYVQKDVVVKLPGLQAVDAVLARARNQPPTS